VPARLAFSIVPGWQGVRLLSLDARTIMVRQIDPARLPPGTYLNTGATANRALRVNRLCYDLKEPGNRAAFEADAEAQMALYDLEPEDRQLIRERDWLGLVKRGANVFPLLRLSHLCGDGLAGTGAQMRGETLEQYLATRQAKGS
jgi:hypothetical protein